MAIDHAAQLTARNITLLNPDVSMTAEQSTRFAEFEATHAQERDYLAKRAAELRPTPKDYQILSSELGANPVAKSKGFQEKLDGTTQRMWHRAGDITRPSGGFFGHVLTDIVPIPTVDHRFWWHRHNWTGDQRGVSIQSTSQGFEFSGVSNHSDGNLTQFDMGVSSFYGLESARRQHSSTGWYSSAPRIDLSGFIFGDTGLRAPIVSLPFRGDYWCTCTLYLRQTIFELNVGPNNQSLKLGESIRTIPIFKIENDYPFGSETFVCPGQIQIPEVAFRPNGNRTTYVNQDIRFVIVQEGTSRFEFRNLFLNMDQWSPDIIR